MSNDEIRKLKDIVLGEAVIAVFAKRQPLSNESLIKQLMQMAAQASDPSRHRVCLEAAMEVRKQGIQPDGLPERKNKQEGGDTLH